MATVRAGVRGVLLGLPIVLAGAGLPLWVLLGHRDPQAGYHILVAGVSGLFGGCAWIVAGSLIRRTARRDRARSGVCPFTGEPAVVARYSFVIASGWYIIGLALLLGAGGLVVLALTPVVAREAGWSLLALVPAGAVYLSIGAGRVRHLLSGRIRRGGVWLTPTGLVHRSWDSGLAVRWEDLASVTRPHGDDDVHIEPRPDALAWLRFPAQTWFEVCGPERIERRMLGARPTEQITALADQCLRDPTTRVAIGHLRFKG